MTFLIIISYFAHVGTTFASQPEDEWVAYPLNISHLSDPLAVSGYSPSQIRKAYNLLSSGGNGTTIAIVIAFHTPSILNDLTVFSNQFGLPPPTSSNFEVHKMATYIATDSDWGQEAALDVEWAHAIAPDAKILLVEAISNSGSDLLAAIDYATSRPNVVAVSMSWGGSEDYDDNTNNAYFNKPGIAFFAASGDDGSGVMWPSSSPNVIAVGGTTLNLASDGTVISEIGWSGSGGGISTYEDIPAYQISYGLNISKRAVPDISYNADPQTGVATYFNSRWYKVGGTSAGAPQWAAIHALGRSVTNINLYQKAKLAYASYFRDITLGSNGGYNAAVGYDYVTGLGSPLTVNYLSTVEVFPTSGSPESTVMLNGTGFTANSNVSISYLNALTSTWVPISDNVTTTPAFQFNYNLTVPDLMQSNPAGDNPQLFDNIFFKAIDNGNGYSCITSVPYTEWRRGLTRIGNANATGVFGNNTDLTSTVFVQAGEVFAVSGKWFSPGDLAFLYDGTLSLGSAVADGNGAFNANLILPTSAGAGTHNITVNDANTNFVFYAARLPIISADYDGYWHSSDYTINLQSDGTGVSQIYYHINGASTRSVNVNGQPLITTEGGSNTLEYWGIWSNGLVNVELPHRTLTDIKLDKTMPEGSIQINNGSTSTQSTLVTLNITTADLFSGIHKIRFSNDDVWDTEQWETPTSSKNWLLTDGNGVKTVYFQIQDNAGLLSTVNSSILLAVVQPMSHPTTEPSNNPSVIPEYTTLTIIIFIIATTVTLITLTYTRKNVRNKKF